MADPRPSQVTIAGWLVIGGSVLAVAMIASQLRTLGTVDTRDAVRHALDALPFGGLTVQGAERIIRVAGMIAAACAVTSAILGWQVLQQRSTVARAWLGVLAAPLLLAGWVSGAFTVWASGCVATSVVAVAVVALWVSPAREWFAGTWRPPAPAERPSPAPRVRDESRAPLPPPQAPISGQAPVRPPAPPEHAWPPPAWPPAREASHPSRPAGQGRPPAVVVATVATALFSGLAALVFVAGAARAVADPGWLLDQMRRSDPDLVAQEHITTAVVRAGAVFAAGVIVLWSVGACVLAVLVFRRVAWARLALMICAGLAGLALIVCALEAPVLILPLLASAGTIGLLGRRDVAAWLSESRQ